MKPLELSSVAEIWKSALTILADALASIGRHPQIWFPWGNSWRGHGEQGSLPACDLPASLRDASGAHFAGRSWRSLRIGDMTWLVSVKADHPSEGSLKQWSLPEAMLPTFRLLGEVVRMECLLGLTLRILENRAGEHGGHWERVRHMAVAIGRQLRLSGADLVEVEMTALLHDIGKVALPPSLLEVTRSLSQAERRQMETHSAIGAGMVREIPGLERVADGVWAHHEAPDGSGYPRNLRGEEIPLASLIVGAADSFDAMTHYRPYAAERTYQDTLGEMIGQRGKYDDRVLWALQEVLRHLGILGVHPVVPAEPMVSEPPPANRPN